MAGFVTFLRTQAARLAALALILVLYGFAQPGGLGGYERTELAARFSFQRAALPELSGYERKSVRAVHPSLEHISAWISSVGASVALNDLDGDGLPNDVCYVDTRIDQVVIAPVPGTPSRYEPFALDPKPLQYDASTMAPMGCLPNDINEDGSMDVLVYYWGRTPIAFLRQAGALSGGGYTRIEVMPTGERWYTNAATFSDLDGDGHADLIIGNYFKDGARILDANAGGTEEMQHSMSRAYNGGSKRILLWAGANPTVRFEEAAGVLDDETAHGWTLALGAADLDGDLLPEIYFANDFGPDRLLHNRSRPGHAQFTRLDGIKGFTTPNSKTLGRDSFKGMGVDFGDLNGDGLLDIYVSNIATEYALLESHFAFVSTGEVGLMSKGIAPYVDRSEQLGLSRSGWGWDSRLADFDNDGVLEAMQATGFLRGEASRWPELQELATGNDEILSNPGVWPRFQPGDDISGHRWNPFFVLARDGRYYDLSKDLGMDQPQVSRGLATADVDGDGRLDFAVGNQWDTSYFYANKSENPRVYLDLHLLLPVGSSGDGKMRVEPGHPTAATRGRPAIGASVKVHLPDGRALVAQVDGGNGHSGKRSHELHFGLGRISKDARLQVDLGWRDAGGSVYKETLDLSPGTHTVLLGAK